MTTRKARLEHLLETAPKGARFLGYGGMSREYETAVFLDPDGYEIRFPFRPSAFARLGASKGRDAYAEIEAGYGCFAAWDWDAYAENCDGDW